MRKLFCRGLEEDEGSLALQVQMEGIMGAGMSSEGPRATAPNGALGHEGGICHPGHHGSTLELLKNEKRPVVVHNFTFPFPRLPCTLTFWQMTSLLETSTVAISLCGPSQSCILVNSLKTLM